MKAFALPFCKVKLLKVTHTTQFHRNFKPSKSHNLEFLNFGIEIAYLSCDFRDVGFKEFCQELGKAPGVEDRR